MKPILRQITATPVSSFLVRKDEGECMINNWHYHPEVELLYMKKSSGTWLIGDHIGHYQNGDVVMLGANLPHTFRHEETYIKSGETQGTSICVKFVPEIFGNVFMNLPESKQIKYLLAKCNCGIKLTGKTKKRTALIMEKMLCAAPGRKLVYLLSMLEEIASDKDITLLSSKGFMQSAEDKDRDRIKLVFDYTFNHYHEKISIDTIASLINMTLPSFCRFFKARTKKTYIQFLMEVRIGSACRLLIEEEKTVAEAAYECGYNTLSHFNQQFKQITGKTPLVYRKDYLNES